MHFITKFASFVAIVGLFAIVAGLFNKTPNVLIWIDRWGEATSWIIKIAMVAIGGLLWFITRPRAINDLESEFDSKSNPDNH